MVNLYSIKETIGQPFFTNKTSLIGIKSLTSDATTSTTTTTSSEAEKIASEIPNTSADGSEKMTSNTEYHPFQIAGANKM